MFPVILKRRAVRRPKRSESVPIIGEAMACRRLHISLENVRWSGDIPTHENKLPRAPPSSTISYLESIGREKDALYALRYCRICARTVGDSFVEENDVGASKFR